MNLTGCMNFKQFNRNRLCDWTTSHVMDASRILTIVHMFRKIVNALTQILQADLLISVNLFKVGHTQPFPRFRDLTLQSF